MTAAEHHQALVESAKKGQVMAQAIGIHSLWEYYKVVEYFLEGRWPEGRTGSECAKCLASECMMPHTMGGSISLN